MNYHDSERMTGLFERMGLDSAQSVEEADVVLINTCAVREKPERKLFAELGRLRKQKQKNPQLIVGVSGCMAPRDADTIRRRAPFVDFLLGPRSLHRLPEIVDKVRTYKAPSDEILLDDDPSPLTPVQRSSSVAAWVDIQFGCNFSCTYCAVPTARGREVSRKPIDIFQEIDELVNLGYKEVMLLGQTVNAYGRDFRYKQPEANGGEPGQRIDFTWLLEQIDRRAPGMRVRFASPHPQFFTDRLINALAALPTVCEHIHLPLQSADDGILARMKRGYTYDKFKAIVHKLREKVPEMAVSTDIIVGFPGETEEKFQETMRAFEELEFDQAFMFVYSPRRHTEALTFTDLAPEGIAKDRLQRLIDYANDSFNRKNSRQLGEVFEILVEGPSEKNPKKLSGRTRTNKTMIFDGPKALTGTFAKVRATESFLWGFTGELVK